MTIKTLIFRLKKRKNYIKIKIILKQFQDLKKIKIMFKKNIFLKIIKFKTKIICNAI